MRLEDINLQNPVGIGYYDPFGALPLIQEDIQSRFPLSNLHWRYHPQQPVRSIPLLPTNLIEEVPNSRKTASNSQATSKIYLRLMFVKVEDVEVYRMQTRPLIIEWLKNSVKDKDVSWAIVMVADGNKATKSSLMKTSIFDKLRSDFGPDGKQLSRCSIKVTDSGQGVNVQHIMRLFAKYDDDLQKLEEYNDFCTTLKSLILETFDRRYSQASRFIEALTPQINTSVEARIKIYLEKLKLAQILNDMRCFSESLELCEELSSQLKALLEAMPRAGDGDVTSVPFIGDLEHFSIEDCLSKLDICAQVSNLLYEGQSIEPFDIKLGLFLRLSNNLQSLANFASSISMSSLYIANLLKELIGLINDGLKVFPKQDKFLQWSCAMCDFYQNLPLASVLIDLDEQQAEANNGSNVMEILEYTGEIKLLKRSLLDEMALSRGLSSSKGIGIAESMLEDISLDDKVKTSDLTITYPAITSFFESQEAYDESFEALSLSAMQDFAKCDRIKTVDLLSIDLAFLHFKKKQYQEAFDIFSNSYEYFSKSGWNLMGGIFLEMYLECLSNLEPENSNQIVTLSLDLFATLRAVKNLPEDINTYHIFKSRAQREQIFTNICHLSEKLEQDVVYSLDALFTFDIKPYIEVDEDVCKNYIELQLTNQFGINFRFTEVYAILSSQEEHISSSVRFSAKDVSISSSAENTLRLHTNEFRSGAYIIDEVGIKIADNVILSYNQSGLLTSPDDTVVYVPQAGTAEHISQHSEELKQVFYLYPSPKILRIEFEPPQKVELGSNYLQVAILNGPKEVKDLELKIQYPSFGLNVQSDYKTIQFESIKANGTDRAVIEINSDSKIVDIVATCSYKIGEEVFETYVEDYFDTKLSISISVQDIFRSAAMYSKFQIGCAQSRHPIKVTNCEFTCSNNKYEVLSSSSIARLHEPYLVSPEQSAFVFYKLIPKCDSLDPSDTLDLRITHSNLHKECEQLAKFALQEKFAETTVHKYLLIAQSIVSLMKFDLSRYGVEGQLHIFNKNECKTALHAKLNTHVTPKLRELLLNTFSAIFQDDKVIFPDEAFDTLENQILHIPVSVPYLDMLHRVKFQIKKDSSYVVGEPIDAKLIISSTSRWALTKADNVLASSSPKKANGTETMFEVTLENEENWLVSGVYRQSFSVVDGYSIKEIDVCLVPLNVGEILFPRADIRAIDPACTLDVVHENASETVFVTPDLQSVSVTF